MNPCYQDAVEFAKKAHRGQKRRYTGEPYVNHCIRVAKRVQKYTNYSHAIAAAVLHDTLEDTATTSNDILHKFGTITANHVVWLTEGTDAYAHHSLLVEKKPKGNRATRKAFEWRRFAHPLCPLNVHIIKTADLVDNAKSIKKHDPKFWKVYRREALFLLDVLSRYPKELREELKKILE